MFKMKVIRPTDIFLLPLKVMKITLNCTLNYPRPRENHHKTK